MEMKQILIRLRPETHDLLKDYCKHNRRSMASLVDEIVLRELKSQIDEANRLEVAQRNAGAIT